MEYTDSLPARMKNARIAAKMTQAEAAKSLGITAQAISNFERGTGSLSPHNINALCDLYGIDPSTSSEQAISQAESIAARTNKIIASSYATDPDLLAPIARYFNSILDAVDHYLQEYSIGKHLCEITLYSRKHARECERLMKALPAGADSRLKEAYALQLKEYKRDISFDYESPFRHSHRITQEQLDSALTTFSDQLNTVLEKMLQEVASAEESISTDSSDDE